MTFDTGDPRNYEFEHSYITLSNSLMSLLRHAPIMTIGNRRHDIGDLVLSHVIAVRIRNRCLSQTEIEQELERFTALIRVDAMEK